LEDFGSLNFICVGGLWNGYTERAKEFCMEKHIGLYNTSELSGGLWKDDYLDYTQKKEIVSIIIKANVQAVYGFGSFFRDSSFSDVDIIIVSKESENNLVNLHRQLCGLLGEISSSIQLRIDFTLLTEDEFSSVQLRERNRLIKMTRVKL
jgi:predicted nucleotidyltransferase